MKRILLIITLLIELTCNASIITVTNTDNIGTGSFWEAIQLSNEQDTINFDPNLILNGSDTIHFTSTYAIWKAITINGLYNTSDTLYIKKTGSGLLFNINMINSPFKFCILDSLVLISDNTSGNAIHCENANSLTISNSIIRGFKRYSSSSGTDYGTIDCFSYNDRPPYLIIENSSIIGNRAVGSGGGVSCHSIYLPAKIEIHNSLISNNFSDHDGGGVSCYSEHASAQIIINRTEIENNSSDSGGGISSQSINDSSTIIINNSNINSNTGGEGSGIFLHSGYSRVWLTITKSNITNNYLSNSISWGGGGGIRCNSFDSTIIMIDSCDISNNTSNNGGGIFCNSEVAKVNIKNSSINNNYGHRQGGGIYLYPHQNSSAFMTIENSTLNGNSTQTSSSSGSMGGGISAANAIIEVKNSTISENSSYHGGAIFVWSTNLSFINSTIVGNSASFGDAISYSAGIVEFTSSILALNDNNHKNFVINSGGNNIFNYAPPTTINVTDQYNADSLSLNLGPFQNNGGFTKTFRPLQGSIAIDLGNPLDLSDAQNGPISGNMRDVGATEHCISGTTIDTLECTSFTVPSGTTTYTNPGIYSIVDTLNSICSMDSIIFINLIIGDNNPPVPDNTNLPDIIELCSVTSLTTPTATDDCSTNISITNDANFPITSSGLNIVTWTYDDQNGNTIAQTQNVTIQSDLVISTTSNNEFYGSDGSIDLSISGGIPPYSILWNNGETVANIQNLAGGLYFVDVTDGNGCTRSDTILVDSELGIKLTDTQLNIIPNPNNGTFKLKNNHIGSNVNIYGLDGKLIKENIVVENSNQIIRIEGIEKGIYFLKISSGGQIIVQRFIVN